LILATIFFNIFQNIVTFFKCWTPFSFKKHLFPSGARAAAGAHGGVRVRTASRRRPPGAGYARVAAAARGGEEED
jgi:hypothetical protein